MMLTPFASRSSSAAPISFIAGSSRLGERPTPMLLPRPPGSCAYATGPLASSSAVASTNADVLMPWKLLGAHGNDRVHCRGPARGEVAGDAGHHHEHERHRRERERIRGGDAEEQRREEPRQRIRARDADHDPKESEREPLAD